MTTLWAMEAAARFWEAAGGPPLDLPRDLRLPVMVATPLGIVDLPRLGVAAMARWLAAHGAAGAEGVGDRPLRAALYAGPEGGFIFLDGADPEDERRFSLAHEAAHFIVEYLEPRRRAITRVGPGIAEALDGLRPPTVDERVDAALAGLDLRPRLHLLERTAAGQPRSAAVTRAEARADELALELLAPGEMIAAQRPPNATRAQLRAWLQATFGLPALVADARARELAPPERGPRKGLLRLVPGHDASA